MSGYEPPAWAAEYHTALAQGDYLRGLLVARDAADDSAPISFINDAVVYLLQAVGRFADADAVRDHRTQLEQQRGLEALPPQLQQAMREAAEREKILNTVAAPQAIDLEQAPAALASAVRQHRVVVLGELHHHPEHRAFGARVLAHLRSGGVTHLALETGNQFTLDQAQREARIRPTTDPLSFEPQRAALLRAALRLELPIVAFDMDANDSKWLLNHPGDMQFRERRMAEHIAERVLQPEPAARVLVWVSHQHGQKIERGLKMMAMHLWDITAEEPFSAYQLTGAGNYPGVDLLIRHPEPTYLRGRPDWLRVDRLSVQGTIEPPAECLVQLHPAAEGTTSTPADQLLTEEDGQFELLVPAGDYPLRVWTAAGHVS
ncbi:MAG: hypothetical protein ACR2IK_14915 [Chloroflexota bacterium]